ncbi:MAG: ISNCY family transposase [Polyangiaceae bacterium]|nr:ISNCY family transposase [Polyangiaceae bacterium]
MTTVHADLVEGTRSPHVGRGAMSSEQVLRALIVKQLNDFSYDELGFHLQDSLTYRRFCRFGMGQSAPKRSTLQANMKRIKPSTLEMINCMVIREAVERKIESGTKVRIDCTVVDANIHPPTDSTLLRDCVRVLVRLMKRARRWVSTRFVNHLRRVKRRVLDILNAKAHRFMIPKYREILKLTSRTLESVKSIITALGRISNPAARRLQGKLLHFCSLAERVVDQTTRRVVRGEKVPAQEKVVSIFEPHTDVIVKDRRETFYGHKVCLAAGSSGLVVDLQTLTGNPGDSTLAVSAVKRAAKALDRTPSSVAFDGGFAARQNLTDIRALGVKNVVFSKHVGFNITEMARDRPTYKALRNFRAGIEASISTLKRAFGFARCTWRGRESFHAYAWSSVLACNLLQFARHLLS